MKLSLEFFPPNNGDRHTLIHTFCEIQEESYKNAINIELRPRMLIYSIPNIFKLVYKMGNRNSS